MSSCIIRAGQSAWLHQSPKHHLLTNEQTGEYGTVQWMSASMPLLFQNNLSSTPLKKNASVYVGVGCVCICVRIRLVMHWKVSLAFCVESAQLSQEAKTAERLLSMAIR